MRCFASSFCRGISFPEITGDGDHSPVVSKKSLITGDYTSSHVSDHRGIGNYRHRQDGARSSIAGVNYTYSFGMIVYEFLC